ncbi:MAG: type IV secretory system conjugative DNA transfer family protein [Actinomycetia bacterium]|nr:type IV secretory system conjugative DNA transfer family protein [Actinomycetes bacterium]
MTGAPVRRTRYLLGVESAKLAGVVRLLGVTALKTDPVLARPPLATVRRLAISTKSRPLDTSVLEISSAAILAALDQARRPGEELALQLLLGPRLAGSVVGSDASAPVPLRRALVGYPAGNPKGKLDAEARGALAAKISLPGFTAAARLGVSADSPARRQQLAMWLLGALKRLESPGLSLRLRPDTPAAFGAGQEVTLPGRPALRLNIAEAAALAVVPVGEHELPGLTPLHPRSLPVPGKPGRPDADHALVGVATAPACAGAPLLRSTAALLRHTYLVGPTGGGKSVLALNLVLHDIAAGRGVVVIEPKGDLVQDILERIPASRADDVVVFDPLRADGIVGLNPLNTAVGGAARSPELRADSVYSIFREMFGDSLGVRSADILNACLLTLAAQPDASLVQIPTLLTNPAFRRPRVARVAGDIELGRFWADYESYKDPVRATITAPLMNKLRAVVMKPSIRRVLGQARPKFDVRDVFTKHRILLVPLPVHTLGDEGGELIGSLVTSQLWDAAREQAAIPPEQRTPVSIYLDEVQKFLRLGGDVADALATSRSYAVGWTLANQYLGQLGDTVREAVLTNCRSRVVFQTGRDDATVFAKSAVRRPGSSGGEDLTPEDFMALGQFEVYASLFDHGQTQPFASGRTLPPPPVTAGARQLREQSARRYGVPAEQIEADFASWSGLPADTSDGALAVSTPLAEPAGAATEVGLRRRVP